MIVMIGFCVAALAAGSQILVSPEQLGGLENGLFVDVRSREEFAAGHVPGSAWVPVADLSENRDGVMGLLKPVEALRTALANAGVDPKRHILICPTMANAGGLSSGTRLFWILEYLGYSRVSIIDGGYEALSAFGKEPETGPSSVKPIDAKVLELPLDTKRLVSREDVAKAIESGSAALKDTRSPAMFAGTETSPAAKRGGHLPGATNIPAETLIEQGRFKPQGVLKELIEPDKSGGDKPVITYCNTGRSASVGYFVYRLIGKDDVALYDGSMSEWTSDPAAPVETKP